MIVAVIVHVVDRSSSPAMPFTYSTRKTSDSNARSPSPTSPVRVSLSFYISRRRREMYCGHARLSVCVSVCLSVCSRMRTLLHRPGCNLGTWESGRVCPLVVHYWTDLQSVHGLRCYGSITRTRNVSEYVLVLALCLV